MGCKCKDKKKQNNINQRCNCMTILNTHFSEIGFKDFLTKTREEQEQILKSKNPLYLLSEIRRALHGVKSAKRARKVAKSHKRQTARQSTKDS